VSALLAGAAVAVAATAWPPPVAVDHAGALLVGARGFEVHVEAEMFGDPALCVAVLGALRSDLETIEGAVPASAFALLRERVPIWIEARGARVPGGMSGRGMVFHPSGIWLKANGLDPARAGGIEIVRAEDYLDWRGHQPMMVLHELAHALHHLVGADHPAIESAFDAAVGSGAYETVGYVNDAPGGVRRAYALTNSREYFAELSEAYFGRNDFAPFDREGLVAADPGGAAMVRAVWWSVPAATPAD
jgi:hypothetical protein